MKRKRVAVAVSGGRDSTALWHATARFAAATAVLEVVALHVHHGLQAQADGWVKHLERQAKRWAARGLPVRLQWRRLQGAPAKGESTEAWARRGRYVALAEMAQDEGIDLVLLAHHRRDQAETFLLQALRGAGPAGLSGMPRVAVRQGITWARPWLDWPCEAVEAYVQRHRLGFIEDPSNADIRWSRNRLRHAVWPALAGAFVHAESPLAASCVRAQEAAACLQELAEADQKQCCTAAGQLQLSAWRCLSEARRANLLRAWISARTVNGVPETLVQRLLQELPRATFARWLMDGGELRLHGGLLAHAGTAPLPEPAGAGPVSLDLSRVGRFEVPDWRGAFEVNAVDRNGIEPELLRRCVLRPRGGGERFQRQPASLPRSLKKQYQAAGVPAWARSGPLVFAADQLLYVPALGIDARCLAPHGKPMLGLRWVANAADVVYARAAAPD